MKWMIVILSCLTVVIRVPACAEPAVTSQSIVASLQKRESVLDKSQFTWVVDDQWKKPVLAEQELARERELIHNADVAEADRQRYPAGKKRDDFISSMDSIGMDGLSGDHDRFVGCKWNTSRVGEYATISGNAKYSQIGRWAKIGVLLTPDSQADMAQPMDARFRSARSTIDVTDASLPLRSCESSVVDLRLSGIEYAFLLGIDPTSICPGHWHLVTSKPDVIVIAPDAVPHGAPFTTFEVSLSPSRGYAPMQVMAVGSAHKTIVKALEFRIFRNQYIPNLVERGIEYPQITQSTRFVLSIVKDNSTVTPPFPTKSTVADYRVDYPHAKLPDGRTPYAYYDWAGKVPRKSEVQKLFFEQNPELKPKGSSRALDYLCFLSVLLVAIGIK